MSLFFDLRVTTGGGTPSLGSLEVQRASHRDEHEPAADTWCTYSVRLDGRDVGEVQHRYGDGPWALAGKAATMAWAHRAMAEADGPHARVRAAQRVHHTGQVDGTRILHRAMDDAAAELRQAAENELGQQ